MRQRRTFAFIRPFGDARSDPFASDDLVALARATTWSVTPAGIIAFAKDWEEDPTSNHHVLRELAKSRRVLWLDSIATRTPSLSSGRDLGKIRRKLSRFVKGPINVENDLWVFSPLVAPFPHSALARRANKAILRATIAMLRRRLGLERFHLWTFLPNVADYVGTLGETAAVYYCVDEWSMFSYLDRDATIRAERALLEKVDCVFAVNDALAEAKRAHNRATFLSPHGVDHAAFARALDGALPVPEDIARLPRPVIGFYGTLRNWVDVELLAHVARARPRWSIALLGQKLVDLDPLEQLSNVHLLGRKPHATLPAYCKGMDVGLIPYRIDERMKFVNPVKLREYLSAGLPVVSTPVPEVSRYKRFCTVAEGGDAFVAAIERALAVDTPARRRKRSAAMGSETWPMRVAEVARIVDDIVTGRKERGAA